MTQANEQMDRMMPRLKETRVFQKLLALIVLVSGSAAAQADNQIVLSKGGTIYVPAFSQVAVSDSERQPLAATLVVHNVDAHEKIKLTDVRYYSKDGTLLRDFVDEPFPLSSFQSSDYVIGIRENTGGTGANFVVRWEAPSMVVEPMANALMVGGTGTQGLSFQTSGKVIERHQ